VFDLTSNTGAEKRRKGIVGSKEYRFVGIIHTDVNQVERYMLPNVQIKYTFIRNVDSFSLLAESGNYKIEMCDLYLTVRKIRVKPEFHRSILQNLEKEPALYPLTQSKIKSHLISAGITSLNIQNLSTGNLPKTIIIGFVDDKAFNGRLNKNPYVFKHFDLNHMNLMVNSEPFHKTPLQPRYSKGNYCREYQLMLDNLGAHHNNAFFTITPKEFEANSNFYVFDFSPDSCNHFHDHQTKQGQIDIELGWEKDTPHNIKMIVYCAYRQTMTIDSHYNCLLLE
jgi:hypothetical protein